MYSVYEYVSLSLSLSLSLSIYIYIYMYLCKLVLKFVMPCATRKLETISPEG